VRQVENTTGQKPPSDATSPHTAMALSSVLRLSAHLSASRAACLASRAQFRARGAADCARRAPRAFSRVRAASASARDAGATWTRPSWDVRVLFDGDCPLCVREVNFLRAQDGGRGKLDLVDIASETYDPSSNRGVDFETAMSTIHGITNEGEVITGVPVFERAYAAVGLGWVYAFTKVPALSNAATALYDFWAERRLAVTGRPTMREVMRLKEQREAAGGRTACAAATNADAAGSERS
jgi:predicted DCC family thiol-disulfide oxidoreductase YuxK